MTLQRCYRSDAAAPGGYLLNVTPQQAGWRYLSFKVVRVSPSSAVEENTGSEEIVIVPLDGSGRVRYEEQEHPLARPDLFRERPDIVYLPPGTTYRLESDKSLEVAIGGAPAEGRLPARFILHDEIATSLRGGANVQRGVSTLADSDELTERLTVYEIHTPSGNWSSFPPHRHDTRDNSSYHEETYYYRFLREDGFAMQRIYTRDTDVDEAIAVQHGDVVLVHEGYHPVVKAPGTNAYYLNFLAGDVRKITAVNDPHYDWITKQWDGEPIAIPLST